VIWTGHVTCLGEIKNMYSILVGIPGGKGYFEDAGLAERIILKLNWKTHDLRLWTEYLYLMTGDQWWVHVNTVVNVWVAWKAGHLWTTWMIITVWMWTVFAVRIIFVCSWAEENEPKSQQSQLSVVRSDSHDSTTMIMERDVSELHCLFQKHMLGYVQDFFCHCLAYW